MHGARQPVPRWAVWLGLGLTGVLLLACIVPSFANPTSPTPLPSLTPSPAASPTHLPARTALPGTTTITTRITEQEMNQWLQDTRPATGGVDLRDLRISILQSGITLSGTMQVAQLPNAAVPVEVRIKPVVREQRLALDVLDVRLGGPYAAMSGVVKPLLANGLAQAFSADSLAGQQGVKITGIELQDGYLVVTSVPSGP